VAHVALDRFDQVRNQFVTALELYVDLGEGILKALLPDHQSVVDAHQPEREKQPDYQQHEKGDDNGTHGADL